MSEEKTNKVALMKQVKEIENLPTLPTVVSEILTALENPKTSAEDVNNIISSDPALTAKILKLVNSAFFGFPREISSVTHAVVVLGFATVRNVAITASVFSSFSGKGSDVFNREAFWLHSIGTGVISQLVARHCRLSIVEDSFVAGLLHDLGKIILDEYFHDIFVECLNESCENKISFVEAEERLMDTGHHRIGYWLASKWNMPKPIIEAIAYHHHPSSAPDHPQIAALVHLGDAICRLQKIGSCGGEFASTIKKETFDILPIKHAQLPEILPMIEPEMKKAKILLEL
jgi:HD-like signal output (HDOD) protein